jgi:glucose-1-phosphate thymidylyltransferase
LLRQDPSDSSNRERQLPVKVVIPAAGIGKRLRPHTHSLPKALLYVAGRPIISHILEEVRRLRPSSVVLIVGYKGDLIEDYVKKEYKDLEIDFVRQEQRMGIGHAVHLTRELADVGEPLLVILGDTIIKADLPAMLDSGTNVLGVKEVENPSRFGICEVVNGRITRVVEKPENPPSNLAVVGVYYLLDSALLFRALQEQIDRDIKHLGEYQITNALQMMMDKGSEFVPLEIEEWYDCGKPEAMLDTNRELLKSVTDVPTIKGSLIIPPVVIDPSARVVNSVIGPYVSIASRASVEKSIVVDSILDQGSAVANSLLERSLVGSQSVVKGGFLSLNVGDSSEVLFK